MKIDYIRRFRRLAVFSSVYLQVVTIVENGGPSEPRTANAELLSLHEQSSL